MLAFLHRFHIGFSIQSIPSTPYVIMLIPFQCLSCICGPWWNYPSSFVLQDEADNFLFCADAQGTRHTFCMLKEKLGFCFLCSTLYSGNLWSLQMHSCSLIINSKPSMLSTFTVLVPWTHSFLSSFWALLLSVPRVAVSMPAFPLPTSLSGWLGNPPLFWPGCSFAKYPCSDAISFPEWWLLVGLLVFVPSPSVLLFFLFHFSLSPPPRVVFQWNCQQRRG